MLAFTSGFFLSIWHAQRQINLNFPSEANIVGQIASVPQTTGFNTTFLFSLDQPKHALVRLNWQHAPVNKLWVGDSWNLRVRLKKVHGIRNPGGLDYEAIAFQRRICATGYVVSKSYSLLHKAGIMSWPQVLRQVIQQQIAHILPNSATEPWILALLIGERHNISPVAWEVLRKTGTNHLIAIAGLHLGFMASLAYKISSWCWRLVPNLVLTMPAHFVGSCGALIMATSYAILSGFALPAQRALIMLVIYLLATLLKRVTDTWQPFTCSLFAVLAYDPLNVLTASFWLSFTTIALLLWVLGGRVKPMTWWEHWYLPQGVIAFGLLPLSILIFNEYSLLSIIANSIAIPWVGLIILPLCWAGLFLLGCLPFCAKFVFIVADYNLRCLFNLLEWLAHFPWSSWSKSLAGDSLHSGSYGYGIAAMLGVIVLLLPRGFPGKILGWCWLIPLFAYKSVVPAEGEFKFSLLDVGQGLAAVVQTRNHTVIFDSGPKLSVSYDLGLMAVLPFLANQGIKQVDMLIISHGDNDHAGGALAILRNIPVLAVRTSVPNLFKTFQAEFCLAGYSWSWDGVEFKFLFPTPTHLGNGNNSSCVLRVGGEVGSILLTGDIEAPAQRWLVKHVGQGLASNIIVVPHHGSNTSGIREFINYVHPQYALYAVGYRNRYHFPHPHIVSLYQQSGARQYDTASSGAIQFYLGKNGIIGPGLYRQHDQRYWARF